jgi:thiopeptide-type bacteriocin biosynthesis protein
MIVNFLDLIEGEKGEELRWLFGLRMIDVLLDCFKFSAENKCALLEQLKTSFANEFEMNRFLKKQLDEKFRKEREKINEHLTLTKEIKPEYVPILEVFDAYTIEINPIAEKIKTLIDKDHFTRGVHGLLGSFIHMTMNRLFKSKNRIHEIGVL